MVAGNRWVGSLCWQSISIVWSESGRWTGSGSRLRLFGMLVGMFRCYLALTGRLGLFAACRCFSPCCEQCETIRLRPQGQGYMNRRTVALQRRLHPVSLRWDVRENGDSFTLLNGCYLTLCATQFFPGMNEKLKCKHAFLET